MAREKFPHDEDIKLVQEALQLSQNALLYDENQLPCHLIGRFPSEKEVMECYYVRSSIFHYLYVKYS